MSTSRPNREIQRKPSTKNVWIIEMYDMLCGAWIPYSIFHSYVNPGEGGVFESRQIARKCKKAYEERYSTVYFRVTQYYSERAINIIHLGKNFKLNDLNCEKTISPTLRKIMEDK